MTANRLQREIPASYMRGGTSKGLFLIASDLPDKARADAAWRDALLLRLMGSPDAYEQQIDGMGAATPSTSKVVLVSRSTRPGHEIEYLFGAVGIDRPMIDWSTNCGNLTSAVASFAIDRDLVAAGPDGRRTVSMWQANIGQTIVAHLQVEAGRPVETGAFELDGVAFSSAEIELEFLDSDEGHDGASAPTFPTGQRIDLLDVPNVGPVAVTMTNAGAPTVFVRASDLGLSGTELKDELAAMPQAVEALVSIRAQAAVRMGCAPSLEEAARLPHTPRVAYVAPGASYTTSSGRQVARTEIDLLARILSLGKLHHAMTGTGAVALAVTAAVPGTVVSDVLVSGARSRVVFGHPSGTLAVGAEMVERPGGAWIASKVVMSRSCRTLMRGLVCYPPMD